MLRNRAPLLADRLIFNVLRHGNFNRIPATVSSYLISSAKSTWKMSCSTCKVRQLACEILPFLSMLLTLLLALREYYCSLAGKNAIVQLYHFSVCKLIFEDIPFIVTCPARSYCFQTTESCLTCSGDSSFVVLQVLIHILIDYGILKLEIPTFRTRYVKGIEHGISRIIKEPHCCPFG